jgi:glycosyltransferase involved in cell wall biosynthesis
MYDILIISDDVVGQKMAGPGIRAWEISKSLAKQFKVILAIPDYSYKEKNDTFFNNLTFDVLYYRPGNTSLIKRTGINCKIIMTQGYILSKFPSLLKLPANLIVDMYVPYPLENMFVYKWKIPKLKDREFMHIKDLSVFNEQLVQGDHFLCASQRQRDLLVGSLTSLNRINPEILDLSPSLDELISVVPFGISEGKPQESEKRILRQKYPQIKEDDTLLIWGGVITNWFDPVTLLKALNEALKENQKLKLFFMSTKHANPLLPEFDAAHEALKISAELGLTDKYVFFNEEWINYDIRAQYFRDADIGVSIHKTHFETYFSFRTRILDYLKYNLPIICTEGDYFSGLVDQKNLGITVGSENQTELKKAILELAKNTNLKAQIKKNIETVKKDYYWDKTTEPLRDYCQKVLNGEINKKKHPGKKELKFIFIRKGHTRLKETHNKFLWKLFQKLPLKLTAKIKRLLRSFG